MHTYIIIPILRSYIWRSTYYCHIFHGKLGAGVLPFMRPDMCRFSAKHSAAACATGTATLWYEIIRFLNKIL